MKLKTLKSWAKKHHKLYAFLWGMPLYRKAMSCVHNRLKYHNDREGKSAFSVVARSVDMFLCLWIYGCNYSEYNLYGFSKLSHRERKAYIGECCRKKYYMKLNSVEASDCFRNKFHTYQKFARYYGRTVRTFHIEEGFACFCEIIRACGTAMVKPVDASGGYGIIRVSDVSEDALRESFDEIAKDSPNGNFIIEEYVEQVPELKALHPSSLNTARIITVTDRNETPHILGTLFRIGQGGSVVDNGAASGILCALSDNGLIEKAMDKKSKCFYTHHPDTGHPLVGFTIPRWKEAQELAERLAKTIQGVRYCGWDLALTSAGWIMIEGNEGAELVGIQIFGGGRKFELEKYL